MTQRVRILYDYVATFEGELVVTTFKSLFTQIIEGDIAEVSQKGNDGWTEIILYGKRVGFQRIT